MKKIILFSVLIGVSACLAQTPSEPESLRNAAVNVFLDCPNCDFDYVRTEIPYVNYVRDRFDSDVHILVTQLATGGGGNEYTLDFIGQKKYSGMEDTLKYYSYVNSTYDEIRLGLVHSLKLGLTRFVARTPIADHLSIAYDLVARPEATRDKWRHWVFSVSPAFQFSGSSSSDDKRLTSTLNLGANRVTYGSKIIINAFGSYSEDRIKHEEISGNVYKQLSINRDWRLSALQVWSISDHWSAGGRADADGTSDSYPYGTSKRDEAMIAPTLEYDIFPYSESTRRFFSIDFSVGAAYNYRKQLSFPPLTYDKWQPVSELSAALDIIQPWGNIGAFFTDRQFLDDIQHNSQDLSGRLSLRMTRALFLDLSAQWSRDNGFPAELSIRNQYFYTTRIGITGTFGSIYNNIVNPRMMF